ncbi:hypothetical protein FOZ60_013113, partial [Perkinsus olseni]
MSEAARQRLTRGLPLAGVPVAPPQYIFGHKRAQCAGGRELSSQKYFKSIPNKYCGPLSIGRLMASFIAHYEFQVYEMTMYESNEHKRAQCAGGRELSSQKYFKSIPNKYCGPLSIGRLMASFIAHLDPAHSLFPKLNPDIYLTTSQGQDGSTKVDDLQLQLQSIVKLRGEIQKEIVAQQIKYDSIQSLLEAGRRFKDFHNPTSTPCPSQGNESTVIVRTRYDSAVCLASIEASNSELIPFLLDDLSQMTLARLEIWDGNLFWHQASKDRRYVSSMRACFRLPLLFLVILIIREE